MNFRIIKSDLNRGIVKRKYLYITALLVIVFLGIVTIMAATRKNASGRYQGSVSLGDVMLLFYRGSKIVSPDSGNAFYISEQYLFLSLCIAFLVGNYVSKDISGVGLQVIIRCESIKQWFFSKIVWCFVNSIMINLAVIITLTVLCFISGWELSFGIHEEFLLLFGFGKILTTITMGKIVLLVVIIPLLSTMAVIIVQMVMSLVLSPVIALLIVMTETVAAIFSRSGLLLSNGLMCIRNSYFYMKGTNSLEMIICAIIEIAIALAAGYIYLNKMDMLSVKES